MRTLQMFVERTPTERLPSSGQEPTEVTKLIVAALVRPSAGSAFDRLRMREPITKCFQPDAAG